MSKSKDYLKKHLHVPENWDKYDYDTLRYSFNDLEELLQSYADQEVKKALEGKTK